MPEKLSSFVQRAGRAARGPNTTGLAVLLVEPKAYSVATDDAATMDAPTANVRGGKQRTRRSKSMKKSKAGQTKKSIQEYARGHGHYRGGRTAAHDMIAPWSVVTSFNHQDPTEGLYLFIQATTCRREILQEVFDNPEPRA